MSDTNINNFLNELSKYYWHENDLSNITVALCNANTTFKELFLRFFFPKIRIEDISGVTREVCDPNGKGSRVDIHISMKSDKLYIIEVKINDSNHHFGQYESAYQIPQDHFGYITNYYCPEGITLGYNMKTWEEFYHYLNNKSASDEVITSYLIYLKKVCNIKIYSTPMNFKALDTIPHFYKIIEEIVNENKNLGIRINYGKSSTFDYSYKDFDILNTENDEIISNGRVMLYYADDEIISVGIASSEALHINELETKLKDRSSEWFRTPSIDSDWWNLLWFSLSDKKIEILQNTEQVQQKQILKDYLTEVINIVRNI